MIVKQDPCCFLLQVRTRYFSSVHAQRGLQVLTQSVIFVCNMAHCCSVHVLVTERSMAKQTLLWHPNGLFLCLFYFLQEKASGGCLTRKPIWPVSGPNQIDCSLFFEIMIVIYFASVKTEIHWPLQVWNHDFDSLFLSWQLCGSIDSSSVECECISLDIKPISDICFS